MADMEEDLRAMAADAALMMPDEADVLAPLLVGPLLPRMSQDGRLRLIKLIESVEADG